MIYSKGLFYILKCDVNLNVHKFLVEIKLQANFYFHELFINSNKPHIHLSTHKSNRQKISKQNYLLKTVDEDGILCFKNHVFKNRNVKINLNKTYLCGSLLSSQATMQNSFWDCDTRIRY